MSNNPEQALAVNGHNNVGTASTALAQSSPVDMAFDRFRELFFAGAKDEGEIRLAYEIVKKTGLDPVARQIYFLPRWDRKLKREVLTPQTSIEGFRLIAERSGKYAGQVGPWWCGPDGVWVDVWLQQSPPAAARVGVLRNDFTEPLYSIATFAEYAQRNKDGDLMPLWQKMPALMLAKCAESLAIRKAFPQECFGLYTKEEMGLADNPTTIAVVKPGQAAAADPLRAKIVAVWKAAQDACAVYAVKDGKQVRDDKTTNQQILDKLTEWRADHPDIVPLGPDGTPSLKACNEQQLDTLLMWFQALGSPVEDIEEAQFEVHEPQSEAGDGRLFGADDE